MFSKAGLKCHLKRRKQSFEENMDLSKTIVCCFASLVLYIFLKQPFMNVRYFVVNYVTLLRLRLCQGDFIRPKQNLSRQ